ncbi:hypothetical protein [Lysobacter sp.]|uniref:hypothetical protein n=1 Tax=Lysobacter sp. TaxID=72226 RepID=UPI002D7643CB|nr:hypothetical protein [Lysobacter sp.]HZX78595.1 hypothetical protein [Lysobacter sp.]
MTLAKRTLALAVALGGISLLSACGANTGSPGQTASKTASSVSSTVQSAIAEAREEIATGNISIDSDNENGQRVELTPKGDLLIDGKAVPVTPEQRRLLLDYRGHLVKVAYSGMDIGLQGADLATKAVTESLKGVFTGNTDDIEKRVEAEADKIRVSALKLCDLLPGMKASQDRLAAALPEFKPYADMTQADIDECREEADDKGRRATAAAAADAAQAAKDAQAPSQQ